MLFTIAYFLGISACGIQGAQRAKALPSHLQAPATVILGFCCGFGGGILRDALLFTYPAAFKSGSLIDITAAVFAAALFYYANVIDEDTEGFVYVADLIGLGTFISIGAEKALDSNAGFWATVMCSSITALGGGIVASLWSSATKDVLRSNFRYRIATIICAYLYVTVRKEGASQEAASVIFIPCTATATSFADHVHLHHFGFLGSVYANLWAITIWVLLFILGHTRWHQYFTSKPREYSQSLYIGEKIFCRLHRLRLM